MGRAEWTVNGQSFGNVVEETRGSYGRGPRNKRDQVRGGAGQFRVSVGCGQTQAQADRIPLTCGPPSAPR